MVKDEETIKAEIKSFIVNSGGAFSDWYVGIAENPKERLRQHNVNDAWIYRDAGSRDIAERIEKYFIEALDTKGNPGGGSDKTTFVYAYKIKPHTKE